jgi:putative PIN family toxin of toxin-antitoxin system
VRFVFSPSILAEYREAGRELESRYGGAEFESFIALLVVSSDMINAAPSLDPAVCNDPDDDKFLTCAAAGGVDIIVSGDRALLAVSGWSGIEVLKPRTFADRYL